MYENSFSVGDLYPTGLGSELGMCITSDGIAVYNGMLTAFPDFNGTFTYSETVAAQNELYPVSTATGGELYKDSYAVDFYAGEPATPSVCGAEDVGGTRRRTRQLPRA